MVVRDTNPYGCISREIAQPRTVDTVQIAKQQRGQRQRQRVIHRVFAGLDLGSDQAHAAIDPRLHMPRPESSKLGPAPASDERHTQQRIITLTRQRGAVDLRQPPPDIAHIERLRTRIAFDPVST